MKRHARRTQRLIKSISSNEKREGKRGPYGGRLVRKVACNHLRLVL